MKRSPMKRSTKPMKRGTSTLKRTTRMKKLGKLGRAKQEAMHGALDAFFERYGWEGQDGRRQAFCQVSGRFMYKDHAHAHHKTPRSELRKLGVKDLDAPHRLVICHYETHLWFIHAGQMGRPKEGDPRRRFGVVEESAANAENGLSVEWSGQDRLDLDRRVM